MASTLLSIVVALLLLLTANTTSATTIGITYNPNTPNLPPPELVAAALHFHHVSAVHIRNPTPDSVRAFSGTNISLFLSLPNSLVSSFARDHSAASLWLALHVLPFHLYNRISLISLGYVRPWPSVHLSALRNLHWSLIDAGINTIRVSTTFSFNSISSFPPSANFKDYQSVCPILEFLEQTNSPFLVSLYPYDVYRSKHHVTPIGFSLFQEYNHDFRDDTGVRYWSLYEMMMAAVKGALTVSGHGNITVIVAETGWPSSIEGNINYAEIYLRRLITYLRWFEPAKQAAEVYIYQLFDDANADKDYVIEYGANNNRRDGKSWGIMHPIMTMKYDSLVFSVDDDRVSEKPNSLVLGVDDDRVSGKPMNVVHLLIVCASCLLLGTFCVAAAHDWYIE